MATLLTTQFCSLSSEESLLKPLFRGPPSEAPLLKPPFEIYYLLRPLFGDPLEHHLCELPISHTRFAFSCVSYRTHAVPIRTSPPLTLHSSVINLLTTLRNFTLSIANTPVNLWHFPAAVLSLFSSSA